MEIGKSSNNSNTSSPENDDQLEKSNEGTGRSYECSFCKRGFTNAQALGGHMNIHRKDKAKAKAKQKNQDKPSKKSNMNWSNFRFSPQTSSIDHHRHHHQYYQQAEMEQKMSYYGGVGGQVDCKVYFPSSNPNIVTENYLPAWGTIEGHVDANLSLGIGESRPVEDGERNVKENEVDLELRLGHDP